MKTILEVLNLSSAYLATRCERPKREAEELIAHVLKCKRIDIYLDYERPLNEAELDTIRQVIKRRGSGEPLQYILEVVEFAGVTIEVNAAVLIPRPETEELVYKIAKQLQGHELDGRVLFDLCTGSGCIAIAIKKMFPQLNVVASDISKEALALAKKNAARNDVEVAFVQGDLFEAFGTQKCDYLISNPPYIAQHDLASLAKEVRDFEPHRALIGGISGLEFYEKIALQLPRHLNEQALVWLEIGSSQGAALCQLFKEYKVSLEKDTAGHDRFLLL